MADRLYIDKSRQDQIREIAKKADSYLEFDNNKELFFYAMALGLNMYRRDSMGAKDGFFNEKDLRIKDEAIMSAMVYSDLDGVEDLVDKEKVYCVAELIADAGFNAVLGEVEEKNMETMILTMLNRTNELYEDLTRNNIL